MELIPCVLIRPNDACVGIGCTLKSECQNERAMGEVDRKLGKSYVRNPSMGEDEAAQGPHVDRI